MKRSPLKRRRDRPRRSGRVRDVEYMLLVKQLPCALQGLSCWGPIEADHAGKRPVGRKADDDTCIPLCTGHHRSRTDYRPPFAGWSAERMRAWCDARIAETRAAVQRLRDRDLKDWVGIW